MLDDETIKKMIADVEGRISALEKRGRGAGGASDEEWLDLNQSVKSLAERIRTAELIRSKRQKALEKKGL